MELLVSFSKSKNIGISEWVKCIAEEHLHKGRNLSIIKIVKSIFCWRIMIANSASIEGISLRGLISKKEKKTI